MKNNIELTDELVEERILALLAPGVVLSLSEITVALMSVADAGHIRQVLVELQQQDAVSLQAQRKGVWYKGYTATRGRIRRQSVSDEIPQPFRELLSRPWRCGRGTVDEKKREA